jgi:hypothetical protein
MNKIQQNIIHLDHNKCKDFIDEHLSQQSFKLNF